MNAGADRGGFALRQGILHEREVAISPGVRAARYPLDERRPRQDPDDLSARFVDDRTSGDQPGDRRIGNRELLRRRVDHSEVIEQELRGIRTAGRAEPDGSNVTAFRSARRAHRQRLHVVDRLIEQNESDVGAAEDLTRRDE
jgi:hypothetical protein